jgi:Xaa-Pro aminopeptidase
MAPDLAPVDDPRVADRRARLEADAPAGGLVWPLPSEAILWDAPGFPAFENLDALYLGDSADAGLRRLPGTRPMKGRFALNGPIQGMRLIKDDHEIALLRRASRATVEALYRSLPLYRDGGSEADIAASVREHYTRLGCEGDSFPPIVASGANALDFHYMRNDSGLVEGEAVITDIGCYAEHYASDYTRTIPVGGRFSPRARALHDALYEAERAAAAACRAGVYLRGRETPDGSRSLDTVARDTLEAHGAPSDFGHGIGHTLGLFAHDVYPRGQPLEAGMVVMIEPGIYIEEEGLGLRLENAYLVHEDYCELLTGGIPSDTEGSARAMAEVR